jgi:hypothetical protein
MAAVLWVWPSANMVTLGHGGAGTGVGLVQAVRLLPDGIMRLGAAMFGSGSLIIPVLEVAGGLALWWVRPARWALAALWAAQFGLVLLLAAAGTSADPSLLRARRFLVVEGFSIAAVLCAGREAPARV